MRPPYWKITGTCPRPGHGTFTVLRKIRLCEDRLPSVITCPQCRNWCQIEASEEVTR